MNYLGREEEAMAFFNRALAVHPRDYHSLRNKGVSLSKLGREEETMALYDRALAVNPHDYHSLREKGVSLGRLGRLEEAMALFDQALALHSRDYRSLHNKSVAFFNLKNYAAAWETIQKAREIKPDDQDVAYVYDYIAAFMGKKRAAAATRKEAKAEPAHPAAVPGEMPSLLGLVQLVRKDMEKDVGGFLKTMREAEEKHNRFLSAGSFLQPDQTLFMILRKWNSYTPIIPGAEDERYVGGGYYIFHQGRGIVIDPGYNFIENFHQAVGKIEDIDDIVLTHAHNDHTIDFESLLSLVYQYNSKKGLKPGDDGFKQVRVFLNLGSMVKFAGLLDLRDAHYLDRVVTLEPGQKHDLGNGLTLNVLRAYHDEVVSTRYSVGLEFIFRRDKEQRSIVITSDTGLFPGKKIEKTEKKGGAVQKRTVKAADTGKPEIWTQYVLENKPANLLVAHMGSLKEEEFKTDLRQPDEVFYPDHLGVIGTARVITALLPKAALVSEFGAELKMIRPKLMKLISNIVNKFCKKAEITCPSVFPADLPFIYDVWTEKVYCVLGDTMEPIEKIRSLAPKNDTFYYFKKSKSKEEVAQLSTKADEFVEKRKARQGLYFKS
ncbi:MAG: MBL fold metallo-hydrolase [Thermodesulfobacteriota bacterium]